MLKEIMPIDIVIGGSPCQDMSAFKTSTHNRDGLKGSKSKLFYYYLRILKFVNPKYFLLENVVMKKEDESIITELLGVKPLLINSSLVCAAERKRLYWTNIPVKTTPVDKGVFLKDIAIESEDVPLKYWLDKPYIYNGRDKKVECTLEIKGLRSLKEVYNLNSKCNTLMCDGDGGGRVKKVYQNGRCRKLTPIEYERLQTLPDNYTEGVSDSARYTAIGNGWTVDIIAHILSFLPDEYFEGR